MISIGVLATTDLTGKKLIRRLTKSDAAKEPLFMKGNDGKDIHDRIVRLINQQFTCTSYSSMISSKFIPEISTKIAAVCGLSIPPVSGELTGMINIYLSKEPTDEEKALLKVILSDISDDITLELKKP